MRKTGKKVVISMLVGALTVSSFSMTAFAAGRNHGANRQTAVCTIQNNSCICDGTGSAQIKTPRRSGACRR